MTFSHIYLQKIVEKCLTVAFKAQTHIFGQLWTVNCTGCDCVYCIGVTEIVEILRSILFLKKKYTINYPEAK